MQNWDCQQMTALHVPLIIEPITKLFGICALWSSPFAHLEGQCSRETQTSTII